MDEVLTTRGADAPPKHLLVVDDEPVILQIIAAVFADEPVRVTAVGSGQEALEVIERESCDLLITDKNLPDVSGLELLARIKELNPHAEVIVVTGYASLDTAIQALELGAFDYIEKPLNNVFDILKKANQAFAKQEMALANRRLLEHLQAKNEELEQALEEAKRLQAELIQSEKLAGIGTLAAGVAHEISSPLFGIMGLAEAISDEDDLSLVREYAADIVEYSRNIRDIVVDLSSYSRTASAEYLTTVDLERVTQDALRLVQRSSETDGVSFDINIPNDLYVHARTNELQQVFVNLIRNATEATRDRHAEDNAEARVSIAAGQGTGEVWMTVQDNGVGIPDDKLGVVFDPFYTTKPPGKGTGLGLNVVYRILTKYRGTVQVESEVGSGTTFRLRFPKQD